MIICKDNKDTNRMTNNNSTMYKDTTISTNLLYRKVRYHPTSTSHLTFCPNMQPIPPHKS